LRRLIPLLVLTACVRQTAPGPDLGACAQLPEGSYTFGEVGIGTCLATPTALSFFQQAGQDYLAIANANAYLDFQSGSVLVVDWSSVQAALDAGETRLLMSDLRAGAIERDNYLSSLAYLPGSLVMLAGGRLSEGATVNTNADRVWAMDLTDPLAPTRLESGDRLLVGADPAALAADPNTGLAFAVNSTGGTVSVIDASTTPLEVRDLSARARLTPERFIDRDGSGSRAELAHEVAATDGSLASDDWTLTWVDASYRAWSPSSAGLAYYTSGGPTWVSSPLGGAVADAPLDSPHALTLSDQPAMDYSAGATIERAVYDITSGDLDLANATTLLIGRAGTWMEQVRSPSAVTIGLSDALYFEGVDASGQSAIGVAWWHGAAPYAADSEPILSAPAGYERVSDPYVVDDPRTGTLRLWASLWDGARWSIGHAESDDGLTWSELTPVLALDDRDVAAPVVTWANGRYELWAASGDGTSWSHARAWSWDGLSWSTPDAALPSELPYDLMAPPRMALLVDAQGAWTVRGESRGTLGSMATAGTPFANPDEGLSFDVSSGYDLSFTALSGDASGGISPGSVLSFGGDHWLFVTAYDALGEPHIASLRRSNGGWQQVDANLTAGSDPVVFTAGDQLYMALARTDAFGITRMIQGTSHDGRAWVFDNEPLFPSGEDFDSFAQRPHSAQLLPDGTVRVWYTGDNGSRQRIAAAVGPIGGPFELDHGVLLPWQLDPGLPGAFDDVSVADPMVFRDGELEHLYYAGFDGEVWSIGHATRAAGGDWVRTGAAMTGQARTFSHIGVRAPVVDYTSDGWELLYAGDDGSAMRVGRGVGTPERFFAAQAFPTVGDTLNFSSRWGGTDQPAIPLAQHFGGLIFQSAGAGSATLDDDRGLLWVTSRLWSTVFAIDVRDDSTADFDDSNFLDLEAVLVASSTPAGRGFRDAVVPAGGHLLYATGRQPDQVAVFDLSNVVDDGRKDALVNAQVGSLPLQAQRTPTSSSTSVGINGQVTTSNQREEDNGEANSPYVDAGAMGMALTPDQRTLLVTHFRENALIAFDLSRGAWGEDVRQITDIGENPHKVVTSPDGRYAVVANYVGEINDGITSATLAIVDTDPASPTYLTVVGHMVNR